LFFEKKKMFGVNKKRFKKFEKQKVISKAPKEEYKSSIVLVING